MRHRTVLTPRPCDFRGLSLRGFFGGALGIAARILPGPLGTAASIGSSLVRSTGRVAGMAQQRAITNARVRAQAAQRTSIVPIIQQRPQILPVNGGGSGGTATTTRATAVAAQTGECPAGFHLAKDDSGRCVKNRRMNVANPKALRRSLRRQKGFVKLAKRALKGSGFKIVTKGSGARRGPNVIVESGPGSVVSR